jgi:WD40 repeat protein
MRVIETKGEVFRLEYTPCSRFLAFAVTEGQRRQLHWHDLARGSDSCRAEFSNVLTEGVWLAMSANLVLVLCSDGILKLLRPDGDGFAEVECNFSYVASLRTATLSPDARLFAYFCYEIRERYLESDIAVRDASGLQYWAKFRPYNHECRLLRFSKSADYLVSAGQQDLAIWSLKTKESVATWRLPPQRDRNPHEDYAIEDPMIRSVVFSPDESHLFIRTQDRLFDWEPGANRIHYDIVLPLKPPRPLPPRPRLDEFEFDFELSLDDESSMGHTSLFDDENPIASSPDGRLLALALGRTVQVRVCESGELLTSYEWPVANIGCLAFAPDALTMAAGGEGGIVIWDLDVL